MRRRKKNYLQLPIILLSLIGLIYLIIFINPNHNFQLFLFKIPALILFFILIFIFLSNLVSFLLRNQRRGIFFGFLSIALLLLSFYHFIHPFFIIMVLALFGVLELVFSRQH
ncbi:MAG: hypothetical protein A2152_01315 [Candidatus Levybacteria bacterium RBG_16_35_6]|nr:MAG: hypothetical protein A2152_01315 [Candidatus Levybacteria bacterium RBG_16_35_6]